MTTPKRDDILCERVGELLKKPDLFNEFSGFFAVATSGASVDECSGSFFYDF